MEELKKLFEATYGSLPTVTALTGGGSPRLYYRLQYEDISVVGVASNDVKENENFLRLNRCLEKGGIRVPHIISVSKDIRFYLLSDLGDINLMSLLKEGDRIEWAQKALDDLIKIQMLPKNIWEGNVGYKPFSQRLVKWDLNYFKYDFLKPSGINFDEEKLEDEFELLTEKLTDKNIISGFMYRDFQSRNIMVKDDELWFIDFQGARRGPITYDPISFIWQAKAPFSLEEREKLMKYYVSSVNEKMHLDKKTIMQQMWLMLIFRTLQVLGAYGFRGLIERKVHFIESIPGALSNLNYIKERGGFDPYPELKTITERLIIKYSKSNKNSDENLTVTVLSFSYKKGYPEDYSGNGGGFMFDCRAIHNPGRYEEYKHLTGKDSSVKAFLEKNDEAKNFIENAMELVSPSVERYLSRGFTSLQVGFGCTGGQHRSVYCAENFARLLKERYPEVNINLIHREQER